MDEDIKAGEVVELKSGSPAMTVASLRGDAAICNWFANGEAQEKLFYLKALKRSSRL